MTDTAATILAEARQKCAAAEVFEQSGQVRSVRFENNKLKRVTSRQYTGVGLRLIVDGRIGFASTTDLRKPKRLVEMAVASAGFGEKPRFDLPRQPDNLSAVRTHDPEVEDVTQENLVDMGREAMAMAREASEEYLFSGSLSVRSGTERILNTAGLELSHPASGMSASVEIEEVRDGGLLQAYEQKSWGQPFSDMKDITSEALEKMRLGQIIARPGIKTMPVVFRSKAVHNLLSPIMTALNGKLVHKGSSLLAGRIGDEIIDSRISIIDDPTLDYAPGSGSSDDEGLPTRRLPLIEDGAVKNYLLDLQTAGLLDREPTGNGYRSFSKQPSPSSANTIVPPGDTSYEDIIRGMDEGLIVDQTLGSGQSNTLAGEFSVNVSLGFLVENGEIKGRVKDAMVAGNVYDLLSRVDAIGDTPRWVGSSLVPPICLANIKLSSQA